MKPTPQEESEILKIYLNSLKLPNKKPDKKIIIAPIGLIGSGKTTILSKLSKHLPVVVMSGDVIRKTLGEQGFDFDSVYTIAERAAIKLLGEGFSVATDSDCINEEIIKKAKERAIYHDATLVWIHINTSEKQCITNIKERGTTIFGVEPGSMIKSYHKRKKELHSKEYPMQFTCMFSGKHDKTEEEVESCVSKIQKIVKN